MLSCCLPRRVIEFLIILRNAVESNQAFPASYQPGVQFQIISGKWIRNNLFLFGETELLFCCGEDTQNEINTRRVEIIVKSWSDVCLTRFR